MTNRSVPEYVGPYRVIEPLGRGGMGEVLLAHDSRLDRRVALKRVLPGAETDPSLGARLRREARLTASLQHPAVVQIFDWASDGDSDYIVFEYVHGETLQRALARRGRLPLAEGLALARRLADGLAYAHRHGVVHRDLKAENVLLTVDGEAKIADFGIARRFAGGVTEEGLTREGAVVGTCRAMSPEQLRGKTATARSDLFSFGVLLYELFTGSSPFLAETYALTAVRILEQDPAPADQLVPGLPKALSGLIDELLEKDPLRRPRDAAEVASRLDTLVAAGREDHEATWEATISGGLESPAESRGDGVETILAGASAEGAPVPKPRRGGWRLGSLALITAALLVGGLMLRRDAPPPLYVAVLEPELQAGPKADDETRLLSFAIRNAATSTLTALSGVFAKALQEVDAVPGPPTAVIRAVAADEAVTSELACESGECWLRLTRVRGADAGVIWSTQLPVEPGRPLATARAVAARLRDAYPERRPRSGAGELRIHTDDYAAYLEVKRSFDGERHLSVSEALERLAEVRRGSPDFLDAYLLAASLEARQYAALRDDPRRPERALELLEEAERIAPGDPETLIQRAQTELVLERLDPAEATLALLGERLPGHVALLDLAAGLARRRGEMEEALARSRAAVEQRPSWFRLYVHAQLAFEQGEIDEARESLDGLLERVPDHTAGRWLLAWLELAAGDVARAAELYESLATGSRAVEARVNLGLARLLLGESAAAAEAVQRAVEAAPDNPLFVLNLADARWLQGRTVEAEALYEQVLTLLDRPDAGGWQERSVRAQALAHLGRSRQAVAEVQESLRLAPRSGQAAFEAALVYILVGDRTAALVNATRAVELGFQRRFFDLPWFDELRRDPELARLLEAAPVE